MISEDAGHPHTENEAPSQTAPPGLANALREATQALHTQAERTGLINDLLRGRASRADYALYLRNIIPAYEALEQGLEKHRTLPALTGLALPAVYRSAALGADLTALHGADWMTGLPLLPAAVAYASRIESVAAKTPVLLTAHAYVRYLGDLNGGQVLMRMLGKALGLAPDMLNFYAFPAIGDLTAFRAAYRHAFDAMGTHIGGFEPICAEAVRGFAFNIAVSDDVKSMASVAL